MAITVRGYLSGGKIDIIDGLEGDIIGSIDDIPNSNVWERYETDVDLKDGIHDIYVRYKGFGNNVNIASIEFIL